MSDDGLEPLALRRGPSALAHEQAWALGTEAALTDEVELGKGPPIDRLVDSLRHIAPGPPDPPRVVVQEALNEFTPKRFSIQVYRQAWRPMAMSLPVLESSAVFARRRAPKLRLDERRLVVGKTGMHEQNGRLRAPWSPIGIRVRLTCYDLPAERTRIELWPQRRRPVLQWHRYLHAGIDVIDAVVAEIDATGMGSSPTVTPSP